MSDTFKSGQWRICAQCLGSIKPKDRAAYVYDEVACMDCLTAAEEAASGEAEGRWDDDIDTIIIEEQ